jgi:starvation-inducible DNA-binding protein
MNELTTLHKAKEPSSAVSKSLQNVLTDTYGLYLATHNYHWNVEGAQFVNLHKLFDEQYNELFQAVDIIAERIRALGDYALPFEGDEIVDILKTTSNAMNKETKADARAVRMVHNLIEMNESVIKSCQFAKNEAQVIVDDESENLIVERITAHQKALWMLKSIVK